MPIFEYTCKDCKKLFEALVSGDRPAICPNCGGDNLEQRFSTYSVPAGRGWRAAQWQGSSCRSCASQGVCGREE